jgi:hypothetical protein
MVLRICSSRPKEAFARWKRAMLRLLFRQCLLDYSRSGLLFSVECTTARYSCRVASKTSDGILAQSHAIYSPWIPTSGIKYKHSNQSLVRCPSRTKVRVQGKDHAAMYAKRASSSPRRRCRRTKTDVCPVICRCHPGRLRSFGRVRDDVSLSSVAKALVLRRPTKRVHYAVIGSAPKEKHRPQLLLGVGSWWAISDRRMVLPSKIVK